MQKRAKTPAAASYSAGYELNVSRGVRLKYVALQMPQMKVFLHKFSHKFNHVQMHHKFRQWVNVYQHLQEQYRARMEVLTKAITPIQSIVRGFNGRNKFRRHKDRCQTAKAEEIKKRWSVYQIQCFARWWMVRQKVARRLRLRLENRHGKAAVLIQKSFRGFLSRGRTVELEKQKLLRHLRKWSHGISNHLVNMKELQNGFSQHVLFQAITITTLPSRPLRDLPKLQYVRTVRRSMVLLYWRLQSHFSGRKQEYQRRQKERREMYLQDLSSQLVEILALGNAKKIRAEQEAYEQQLLREAREEALRNETEQHRLILDSSSKAAVTARRKLEADKQHAYKAKLLKLAEHEKVLNDMLKESEFMKLEEVLMRKVVLEESAANEKRRLIAQQTKLVEEAKLTGIVIYGEEARFSKAIFSEHLRQLVPTFEKPAKSAKKSKYTIPYKAQAALTPGEMGMIKYQQQKALEFQHAALAFKNYLHTLPLSENYIEKVYQTLLDSQTVVEFPETKSVSAGGRMAANTTTLDKHRTALHPIASTIPAKSSVLPITGHSAAVAASLDLKFLSRQLQNKKLEEMFHPVNTISNLHSTTQEVCVKIKGMLTRPQMVQLFGAELGYTLSIAQQQYNMQLQSTLTVDDDAVTKMRLLLQLRHHRQVRVRGYKELILAHAAFKTALLSLHQKRSEVHTTKYLTRQARKSALAEASALEVHVQQSRQALIDLCSSFYVSFHEEVELFLCLFYPVEMLPEEVKHYEEEQNEMIISRRVAFATGGASGVTGSSRNALSTPSIDTNLPSTAVEVAPQDSPQRRGSVSFGEPNLRRNSILGTNAANAATSAAPSSSNSAVPAAPFDSPATASAKMGRRSSRMDTVYIAPKRANKDTPASTSAKLTRSRRESMVYTASTTKKAHLVDPFHALNQIPVNKTLQRKLAASKSKASLPEVDRKLTYSDYWSAIEQEMQYYAVSPVSIIALPAAPIPTFINDGKPHILKYGESGVASKRIDASHVHKHFDQQNTAALNAKLKLKETLPKPQNFLKKEVKLHDIPGFNLFTQSDVQEYDFYLWAEKVLVWSKALSGWFRNVETSWRQHNRMQSLTYLLRLKYLAEEDKASADAHGGGSSNAPSKAANRLVRMKMLTLQQHKQQSTKEKKAAQRVHAAAARDASERQAEQNSLFLLRHLDQADTLDVFELLLCKANYGLKIANCHTKLDIAALAASTVTNNNNTNVSNKPPSNLANVSRMLSADELDVTVAKHPASVAARFIIIQQALRQLDTSADPALRESLLQLTCQNGLLFGTKYNSSDASALDTDPSSAIDLTLHDDSLLREGIFHAVPPSLLLLRALSKEVSEMRGILSKLVGDHAVQVELTPPAAPAPISMSTKGGSGKNHRSGGGGSAVTVLTPVTTEDVLIELQYAKIKPIKYVHCAKDFERWRYEYPSWMHPIVHFGIPAPEETFFRRLNYEMRHGKGGVYTRINALDNRADEAGRVLLRFLRAAVVLHKYVAEKVLTEHRLRTDHCMMMWEDNLSAARRADAEEARLAALRLHRQNRPFLVKLFDCCRPEVAYEHRTRVLHGLLNDSDADDGLYDPSSKLNSSSRTSSKVGVNNSSSRLFKPKYAKISIWTSEEEFQSAVRVALSGPLPKQSLSKRQLLTEVKRIRNDLLLLGRARGCTIETLLARYPSIGSAEEVLRAVQEARQAGAHYTRESYFRRCSWVTGQVVHLNFKGEHTDLGDGFFASGVLAEMSKIYRRIDGAIDETFNQTAPVTDVERLAFPSATAVEKKIQEKIEGSRRASQTRLYYESTAARANKPKFNLSVQNAVPKATAALDRMRVLPEHLPALHRAVAPVHEVWLGGGLRHLLIAMRVVEEKKLNPRGVEHLTSLILPAPEPHLHTAKNMHDQLSGAEGVQQMRKRLKAAALEKKREEELKLAAEKKRAAARVVPAKKGVKSVKQASSVIAKFLRKSSTKKLTNADKESAATPAASPDKRRGSLTNDSTAGKTSPGKGAKPTTATAAAAPVKSIDAMATIAKFLRSRKFNLSVSRTNNKFNYNGTKFRTIDEASVRRINNFNARTAGAKIARFFRTKSKGVKPTVSPLSAEEIADIERRKYQQEVDKILAARAAAEKAENERSILCLPVAELFSRARAGFSDRVLCSDRLWRFATHVTHKQRNLCDPSLRVLKQELPVKALPSLRDLQCAFVAAVFRERYKFSPVSNTLKLGKDGEKNKIKGEIKDSVSMKVSSVRTKAKDKSKAHYVEVIQGLFKIYMAKRLAKEKRAGKGRIPFM